MKRLDLSKFDRKLKILLNDMLTVIKKNNENSNVKKNKEQKIQAKSTEPKRVKMKLDVERIKAAIMEAKKSSEKLSTNDDSRPI